MYKLIQKNQKKLLAVFGVLLMIVFVIPPAAKQQEARRNPVVAHIGKEPLYSDDFRVAKDSWNWLQRVKVPMPLLRGAVPFSVDVWASTFVPRPPRSIDDKFFEWYERYWNQYQIAAGLAGQIAAQIDQHQELFLLLQKEAMQSGLDVPADGDAVNGLIRELGQEPRNVEPNTIERQALRGLLLVQLELQRLSESILVSRPAWERLVATQDQQVRLNLVAFLAEDFERGLAPPTPQQLQEQFRKYANTPQGSLSSDNPLGFGYQIPTRVKLQYIEIPRQAVLAAVEGTGDKLYDWQVKAAEYYASHQSEFIFVPPATRPTTSASTAPSTAPTTASSATEPATAPATQLADAATQPATQAAAPEPTTRPFEQVKEQIIAQLAASDIDTLMTQVEKEVTAQLQNDFEAVRKEDPSAIVPTAFPTTQATTTSAPAATPSEAAAAPTTQPAIVFGPVMTLAHLEELRARIDQKYHVSVVLHEINEWQDAQTLAKLPGIGAATTIANVPFAQYATSFARGSALAATSLALWQPSEPLLDSQHNVSIFRLTQAEPAHAPPDMSQVAQQVEQDWKLAQGYEQARQAAQKTLESAKTAGLDQAARIAAAHMISVGPFLPRPGAQVPYSLTNPAAQLQFIGAAQSLLEQASPSDKNPDSLLELPAERRVLVMELASAQLSHPEYMLQVVSTEGLRQNRLLRLARDWFAYHNVVARLQYTEQKG